MVCLLFIVMMIFIAIFAYVLAPDTTQNANQGDLSIKSKPPGFEVLMLSVPIKYSYEPSLSDYFFGKKEQFHKIPILDFKPQGDKITYILYNDDSDIKVEKEIFLSEFPDAKNIQEIRDNYIKTQKFLLGTDKSGRDYLSRMLVGSRISISIGFVAVFISLVVGVFFGSIAGYYGGKIDAFVMWLINIVWSIPTLLLVIAITLTLGKGFWQVFIAVGLTMWVEVARVV